MENAIRKIFFGKIDEEVHSDFLKFSRGVFENRYLLEGKRQKDKWSVKTSSEFANFLVQRCLEKVKGNAAVKGIIVTTLKIENELGFPIANVKKYQGINQFVIDCEIDSEKILAAM